MRILSVDFAGAIGAPGGAAPAEALPQIAFAGRSNVGKSSLINRMLGRTRTQMARVSARPGKTREINFYRVRGRLDDQSEGGEVAFHLVDLPGYGFARVPESVRASWGEMIDRYLAESGRLRGVVHLVDARHEPKSDDRRLTDFLAATGIPVLVVATKIDKLRRGERTRNLARIVGGLGVDEEQVLPFSALSGEGRDELLAALDHLIDGVGAEGSGATAPLPTRPDSRGGTS